MKLNMRHLYKKIIVSCLILFLSTSLSVFAQSFEFDLENLRAQDELFAKAYDNINIQQAWKEVQEDLQNDKLSLSSITIGIIDVDGVETAHQEFRGTILDDEIVGRVNFGSTPLSARVDKHGHPTPIAGIIGANNLSFFTNIDPSSSQMTGILGGVSPDFDYSLEVRSYGSGRLLWDVFKTTFEEQLSDADTVNLSIGWVKSSALTQDQINSGMTTGQVSPLKFSIISSIWERIFNKAPDTLFVPAAGNDDIDVENIIPANLGHLSNVITVGAVNFIDERSTFNSLQRSNFGGKVGISAPGSTVYAPKSDDNYGFLSGTSVAAPFVTGTAGLLKAINSDLTPSQIKQILIETADPIQTGETDKRIGTGCYQDPNDPVNTGCRLNAHKAVCHPLTLLDCQDEEEPLTEIISQTEHNSIQPIDSTIGPISQTFLIPEGVKQINKVAIKALSSQASEGPVDVTIAIAPFGLYRCQYDSPSNDCFPSDPMCVNGGAVPSSPTSCDTWDNRACASCCTAQVGACAPPGEEAILQTATIDAFNDIPEQLEEVEIAFNNPKELSSPQQYALTIIFDNGLNNTIHTAYSDQNPYPDGEFRNNSDHDMYFRVFGVLE